MESAPVCHAGLTTPKLAFHRQKTKLCLWYDRTGLSPQALEAQTLAGVLLIKPGAQGVPTGCTERPPPACRQGRVQSASIK